MILDGHKRVKRYVTNAEGNHILQSEWTHIDSIEDSNGTTLEVLLNNKENKSTEVTGILAKGSTNLTLSNSNITTASTVDVYTSKYGVNPIDIVINEGEVKLTFYVQDEAISVKIKVS